MKAAANILLCLALAVSLSPARSASYEALSPPVVMALLGNVHNFLACVNLWPFLFLQLLLCLNVKSLWVVLLIPGLSAAGLLAGFIFTIVCDLGAGGLLLMILSVAFFFPSSHWLAAGTGCLVRPAAAGHPVKGGYPCPVE